MKLPHAVISQGRDSISNSRFKIPSPLSYLPSIGAITGKEFCKTHKPYKNNNDIFIIGGIVLYE